jgi:hypothetical protein
MLFGRDAAVNRSRRMMRNVLSTVCEYIEIIGGKTCDRRAKANEAADAQENLPGDSHSFQEAHRHLPPRTQGFCVGQFCLFEVKALLSLPKGNRRAFLAQVDRCNSALQGHNFANHAKLRGARKARNLETDLFRL